MKKLLTMILTLIMLVSSLGTSAIAATPAKQTEPASQYRNVMYYGDWSIYDCQDFFNPSDIDASLLTHLNFAFLDFDENCNLVLCDDYADFEAQLPEHGKDQIPYEAPYSGVLGAMSILREKNPNLKIGISIGGWTRCGDFSAVAASPAKRELLAKNLAKFIDYLGFDFLDVDWEYPGDNRKPDPEGNGVAIDEGCPGGPEDGRNFTLLMEAFRKELDSLGQKNGKHYELSAAMSANYINKMPVIEYDKILDTVDFLNMMTYDLNGSWNGYTGHQSPLYTNPNFTENTPDGAFSIDACIKYLKETYGNSIDYSKIVVGVCSYTRGWSGVEKNGTDKTNPGLYATAKPDSVPDEEKLKGGVFAFHDVPALLQKYGMKEYYDETAQAPYLYGEDTGYFFTYDSPRSVAAKGQYVRENGLGGLICWMASQDRDHVLTKAMKESLIGNASFPDHEIIVKVPDVSVSVRAAGKNTYVFTVKNLEKPVESDKVLQKAERFQKSAMNSRFYITTKSGAKLSPGEDGSDCGTIYNQNNVTIIDFATSWENQVLEAGRSCSFQIKTNKKADINDIVSITMTQRILPSSKEFGKKVVFGKETPTDPKAVADVKLDQTAIKMNVGETATLKATVLPVTAVNKSVTWASTDDSVVTVKDGKLTALKAGSAVVKVITKDGNLTASCRVTVIDPNAVDVSSVTLNKTSLSLTEGENDLLVATIKPANADNKKLTWKSSNPAVATVVNGKVVAVKEGTATITVSSINGINNSCKVIVKAKATDKPNPDVKPDEKPDVKPDSNEWDANKVYNGGERVIYQGVEYQAQWWTRGDKPDSSNIWGVWRPVNGSSVKPDEKPDVKPDEKPDVKPDEKPDVKPDEKPDVKPDEKPDPEDQTPSPSNEWAANQVYASGDIVTYEGKSYECVIGHTSLRGWEPNVPTALWK